MSYLQRHLDRQKAWSLATFGNGLRTRQITAHIRKECDEIDADATSLSEWCDVIALALDGCWRAGFTADDVMLELQTKLHVNELRKWPPISEDNGQPIEHVRDST